MEKIKIVLFFSLLATFATANTIVDEFGCLENSKNIKEIERHLKQSTKLHSLERLAEFSIMLESAKE
jgi:hypothetical protein